MHFATIFKECSHNILTPDYQNYSFSNPVLRMSNWDKNLVILSTFTVQWFLMYSQGCTAVRAISQTFPSSQKRNPISNTSHYQFSLPHYLATSNTFSVSVDLPIWDISYKWYHIICGILCLAFFISMILFMLIHVVACMSTLFLLWPSNSLACRYSILSVHQLMDIWSFSIFFGDYT